MKKQESRRQVPPNYGIEYMGETLRLGNNWQDIVQNIDEKVGDRRVAASLKVCLFEKLRE